MTSEKRAQKFHTYDASLPRSVITKTEDLMKNKLSLYFHVLLQVIIVLLPVQVVFRAPLQQVSICYQAPRFQSAVARVKPITIMTLFVSVQRKWYINQKCDHQDVPVRFTGRHWAMAVGSNRVLGRVVNFVPVVMPTSAAKAYYIQTKFGAWSTDRATEPKSYGRGGSYIKSLSYIKYFVTIIDLPGWKKKIRRCVLFY